MFMLYFVAIVNKKSHNVQDLKNSLILQHNNKRSVQCKNFFINFINKKNAHKI